MKSLLEDEEIEYLHKNFRFTTEASSDRNGSITATELLDHQTCISYIDDITKIMQSPSRKVTAAQFSKRYGFLIVIPSLYAMTVYNKGLDFSIGNIHVESLYQDELWLPNLRLTDLSATKPGENRIEWRDQVLTAIFAENLAKVWHVFSRAMRISTTILWENTAVYAYWLYEKRLALETDARVKEHIRDDFHYLIHEASASIFGINENPLKKYYGKTGLSPNIDGSVRVRKTCCLYYQLSSNEDYCSTCPKIKPCQ